MAEANSPTDSAPSASSPDRPAPGPVASAFARLPTGAKLFLMLSAALLPLALIAILATVQTSRVADDQARARLRIAAYESARAIAIELIGDMTALRVAADDLVSGELGSPDCARVQGIFAPQLAAGARFEITDRTGRLLCGDRLAALAGGGIITADGDITPTIVADEGLVLTLRSPQTGTVARAFFTQAFLRRLGRPTSRANAFSSDLVLGDAQLGLEPAEPGGPFRRVEVLRTDLGVGDLALRTQVRSAPVTSSLIIAMLLPILMWAAAAGISWWVVDRLLLRPLERLRADVAAYTPGEEIDARTARLPAQELRELGETFRAISRTVVAHEAGLEEGLRRQTKLTREVHHRVKNNLQVIASLINFHARGAESKEATDAYASIQRRVDALAVVHRHHFAELEEHRGLNLRTMVGELASNLRATASERAQAIGLTLDVDAFLVNQDVAVAVAFLVTEMIELAITCDPAAQVRVAVKPSDQPDRAVLRVVSRALTDGGSFQALSGSRYGRVMEGLARQLRSKLHHDPLTGAFEIAFAVTGHD